MYISINQYTNIDRVNFYGQNASNLRVNFMFKTIIILCSLINAGDRSNAIAVYEQILKQIPSVVRYDIDASKDPVELVKQYTELDKKLGKENYVIVTVGEKGIQALELFQKEKLIPSNVFVAAGMYQYFHGMDKQVLDYVSLPESAVNTDEAKRFIESVPKHRLTFAVPSKNPTLDELKKNYDNWDVKNKPDLKHSYIIVMLSGDAPDITGKMRYFTKESAQKLFDDVYGLWEKNGKKHKIIVQNGPRTGKFNPKTGEIANLHDYKKGKDSSVAIDDISKEFLSMLDSRKILYQFYNFAFEVDGDKKKPISVYNQLLYISLQNSNPKNYFILPAESVSSIGQITLYLNPDQIIAFRSDSMNESHEEILRMAIRKNYLSYFTDSGEVVAPNPPASKRVGDDASDVANDIIDGFNKKFH